ncbi:MAG: hypothetical protein QOJ99_4678 [Bryobacterales bacterium]|nr:hypothetical protein [Bryobacterales bacterium]
MDCENRSAATRNTTIPDFTQAAGITSNQGRNTTLRKQPEGWL